MKQFFLFISAILFLCVSCATQEGAVSVSKIDKYEITSIQLRGAVYSTPVKTTDNMVVLGTHKKSIYFLTHDSIKNVFRTKLWVHATPEIVYDSLIAIGSYDGNMYFFNKKGNLIKKIHPGGRIFTNSVQLDSLWIAFATGIKGLWFYNIVNDSLFSSKVKRLTHGSPTALGNKLVCVGSNDKKMYFFDNVGTLLSTFKTQGWIMHSQALAQSDTTIVFGSYDKKIYSISSTGRLKWAFDTKGKIHASPREFDNGNIICGSFDNNIYIVDSAGHKISEIKTDKAVVSSAAIINGKYAAVGSYDKHLYLLNSQGEIVDKIFVGGKIFSSPIVIDDQTIFCATTNGKAIFIKRASAF